MPNSTMLHPGDTIGVFGSGQLGRMLGLATRPLGLRFACFGPEANSPAGQVADWECVASYEERDAVSGFVRRVQAVTFEFENVPAHVATLAAEARIPVRPAGRVLHTSQQRLREKGFLRAQGIPTARWAAVRARAELDAALALVGLPAVLKTAAFGYDGKGQVRIDHPAQASAAWDALFPQQAAPGRHTAPGPHEAVLEEHVAFTHELSVVAARGSDGSFAHYGAIENSHAHHILDLSVAPARIDPAVAAQAVEIAHTLCAALEVVGVLCVELFLAQDGRLLVNEIAPRPHNSGHLTIEAAPSSQFEQQARAVAGLPLGATDLRPAAMANLLGDLWQNGEPDWRSVLALPGVKLHLYGKRQARVGRKMGHLTAVAATADAAEALVRQARSLLSAPLK